VRILKMILMRSLQMAVLAMLVISATFFLHSLIPGDFFSAQEGNPGIRRQTIEQMRRDRGLDQPVIVQYGRWLDRCVRLDLGESLFYGTPVRTVVLDALGKTLWLGIPALALGILGGIWLGIVHAVVSDRTLGAVMDFLSTAAFALPSLVLGICALLLAAWTGWFPLGSMSSSQLQNAGFMTWLVDRVHHLVLPVLCLTLPILAYVEKIQCAATRDVLEEPFLQAARARGLNRRSIYFRHVLRPSLNPILSTAGPLFGSVLSGSLILEVIFAWPGLGQVTYDALFHRDVALLAGCVVGSTVLLVMGNLGADFLLLAVDPRTRIQKALR
jgi:peptide/nickel transport system permease protein